MKTSIRNREGVTIVDLQGKITIGEGDVILRDTVHEALEAGSTNIVLNMKKASKMDSSGMGELIAAHGLYHRFHSLQTVAPVRESSV